MVRVMGVGCDRWHRWNGVVTFFRIFVAHGDAGGTPLRWWFDVMVLTTTLSPKYLRKGYTCTSAGTPSVTYGLVDAYVSDVVESLVSRGETCMMSARHGYAYGGYTGLNSGTAEVIAVSYCAPDLFCDCTAPDALY